MDTYDFASKHLYRARREVAIDRMISKPRALRRVAFLDTGEALDTISYLRRGYRADNLWAVNRNPAECAHLTMKLKAEGLPKVNTVGLDFEDAIERDRLPQDLDIVDFDGMANIGDKLLCFLSRVSIQFAGAVLSITILAGRESEAAGWGPSKLFHQCWQNRSRPLPNRTSFGKPVIETHARRLFFVLTFGIGHPWGLMFQHKGASPRQLSKPRPGSVEVSHDEWINDHYKTLPCMVHLNRFIWDVYRSISGQPMMWVVASTERHRSLDASAYLRLRRQTHDMYTPWCLSTTVNLDDERRALVAERQEKISRYYDRKGLR